MLPVLNVLFFVAHDLLIAFNLFGWIWPSTRRWHLLTMGATLFSWLIMGAFYGWGYCACTDAHFAIRRELGIHGTETSYVQLALHRLPGVSISRPAADTLAVGALVLILIATTVVWLQDRQNQPSRTTKGPLCATREP